MPPSPQACVWIVTFGLSGCRFKGLSMDREPPLSRNACPIDSGARRYSRRECRQPIDFRSMKLSGIDLNILVALDALLSERNVTRAAARIGRSQPATSHALNRARELFG